MMGRDLFYFRAVKGSVLSGRLLSSTAIKTERRTPPVTIATSRGRWRRR